MQDRDIGDAECPGQLEAGLQPAGHGRVVQDGPGLVDHDQPADVIASAQHGLQPGGGTRHEDAERARGVQGREIEHDEGTVEVHRGGRGAVEHAGQVALDQPPQLESHLAAIGGERGDIGVDQGGRRRRRP